VRRRSRVALLAVVVVATVGLAVFALSRTSEAKEVVYLVPAGTAARVAAGESVSVLPATILLNVGDTLVIRNQDAAAVQVGPFRIEPGQTLSHLYRAVGVYDLECSVHKDGKLTIVVR
jgi:plastocyanin